MRQDQSEPFGNIEQRVETWRAAVRSAFVELHVEPVDHADFRGSLVMAGRVNLEVADIRAAGQRVERNHNAIRRSLRQVHAICADLGSSFGRMLLATRLEAVRQAMIEGSGERIGTIAFACGFSDPSHFARAFRARFGVAPRDYGRAGTGAGH
jgi:AraC-like DNA-binding protein